MNTIKQCLTAIILLLSLPTIAQHSYPVKKNNADSAWARLGNLSMKSYDLADKQSYFLKYRKEGLKFWNMFPTDPRRYNWLFFAVGNGGHNSYLKIKPGDKSYDAILFENGNLLDNRSYIWPVNNEALKEWELIYPQLRKDFLTYVIKNPKAYVGGKDQRTSYPINLLAFELNEFLSMSLNRAYRRGNKIDLNKLRILFLSSEKYLMKERFNHPTAEQGLIFKIMDYFISIYAEYGLKANDMFSFFNSIKNSSCPVLRNWGIQRSNLFALRNHPLSFSHTSMNGELIELEKMRGKVVLVDFWSTSCSSCIARMPAIKVIYDKYKTKGFEVISACLANENEQDKIKVIENKIGAAWPILLIGKTSNNGSLAQQIWRKYGFWGVPQLLLLNKEGKLVMLNDKLRNGDFEPLVKQLLVEKYDSN